MVLGLERGTVPEQSASFVLKNKIAHRFCFYLLDIVESAPILDNGDACAPGDCLSIFLVFFSSVASFRRGVFRVNSLWSWRYSVLLIFVTVAAARYAFQ